MLSCQKYFGGIAGSRSLHVGDQFLSIGANDFKVNGSNTPKHRCSATDKFTGANEQLYSVDRQVSLILRERSVLYLTLQNSPAETVALLDEVAELSQT